MSLWNRLAPRPQPPARPRLRLRLDNLEDRRPPGSLLNNAGADYLFPAAGVTAPPWGHGDDSRSAALLGGGGLVVPDNAPGQDAALRQWHTGIGLAEALGGGVGAFAAEDGTSFLTGEFVAVAPVARGDAGALADAVGSGGSGGNGGGSGSGDPTGGSGTGATPPPSGAPGSPPPSGGGGASAGGSGAGSGGSSSGAAPPNPNSYLPALPAIEGSVSLTGSAPLAGAGPNGGQGNDPNDPSGPGGQPGYSGSAGDYLNSPTLPGRNRDGSLAGPGGFTGLSTPATPGRGLHFGAVDGSNMPSASDPLNLPGRAAAGGLAPIGARGLAATTGAIGFNPQTTGLSELVQKSSSRHE